MASITDDQSNDAELWLPFVTAAAVVGISDRNVKLKHAFFTKFFISFILAFSSRERCFPLNSGTKVRKELRFRLKIRKFLFEQNDFFDLTQVVVLLFNIDHGDASTAKLHVLIAVVADVGDGGQILADELAQDAATRSV